jgi:hypothetical protein
MNENSPKSFATPTSHPPLPNWHPGPWSVPQALAGSASIAPDAPVEAGSWQSFTIVYTAGKFGIDDSGALKICFRFASDMTKPQFADPAAPGYTTVEASNGAVLETRFDYKMNVRPWDRTLYIKVVNGFLKEGDTITIRLGDRRNGSPGVRMQTFAEPCFEFRVLVDPIACYHFTPVAKQPAVPIEAGERRDWVAILPSTAAVNQPFDLRIRSEDHWGNPSGKGAAGIRLSCATSVEGLPVSITLEPGRPMAIIPGLVVRHPAELTIQVAGPGGVPLACSNPLRVTADAPALRTYWADFHAQSGETIGTSAAFDYFAFARDLAGIDIVGHQGNDFQITPAFWTELNRLYDLFDEPGRFVTLPGYEWSGNTALGGDRNVFFRATGRKIRRSSHALIDDQSDLDTDCHTAADLFAALTRDGEDAITFAHVGGRYADIGVAHDVAIETAVEVHSSWGTFEWIAEDAFRLGLRVGIVANSDGHKGRPGAEGPGASMFGAYGGLTAVLLPELSRDAVFGALRARRHYATTGSRMLLDVRASFASDAVMFTKDPVLGPCATTATLSACMGAIVHADAASAVLTVDVTGCGPVERVEIRNGVSTVAVLRPFAAADLGRRIRVVWSGAEYRGRFRMTPWDGKAVLTGNTFESASAINFFNKDKELKRSGDVELSWESLTTGNFSGFDALLGDPSAGVLHIQTKQGAVELPVAEIGLEARTFEFGGLGRKISVYRLPEQNRHRRVTLAQTIPLVADRDNPLWVCVTTEDGHQAWSTPIYAVPKPEWLR